MNREAKKPPLSDFLTVGVSVEAVAAGEVSEGAPGGARGQPGEGGWGLGLSPGEDRGQKDSTILNIPV